MELTLLWPVSTTDSGVSSVSHQTGFSELAAPALGGCDVLVLMSAKLDGKVLHADYLRVVGGDDTNIVVGGEYAQ